MFIMGKPVKRTLTKMDLIGWTVKDGNIMKYLIFRVYFKKKTRENRWFRVHRIHRIHTLTVNDMVYLTTCTVKINQM